MTQERNDIINKAKANADVFRPLFLSWIGQNIGVYQAFEHKALRLWKAGREHYSARRIFEELRNDTVIAETPAKFRLNNDYFPDAARLFMLLHPECGEFFELRGRMMQVDERQVDMFGVVA